MWLDTASAGLGDASVNGNFGGRGMSANRGKPCAASVFKHFFGSVLPDHHAALLADNMLPKGHIRG